MDLATANAELNNFTPQQCRFVRCDAESYIHEGGSCYSAIAGEPSGIVISYHQPAQLQTRRSDVESYMKEAAATGEKFDIVILDPPKLAPSRQALDRASRKYAKLNVAAGRLVKPGGVLMTCSCSGEK